MWYQYSETLYWRILNMVPENHIFLLYHVTEACINMEWYPNIFEQVFFKEEDVRDLDESMLFVFNFELGSRFWLKNPPLIPCLISGSMCHTPHFKHDKIFSTGILRSLNVKWMFQIEIRPLYAVPVPVIFALVSCFRYYVLNVLLCYNLPKAH